MYVNRLPLLLSVAVVFSGCDVSDMLPTSKESRRLEDAQRLAEQQQTLEKEDASKLSGTRQALAQHLAAVKKTLAEGLSRSVAERKRLAEDSDSLSDRIRSVSKAEADVRKSRAETLSALLGDDTVNSLAKRYLGRDFLMLGMKFEEERREADAKCRRREDAEAKTTAEYEQSVKSARAENERARNAALQAASRLSAEIEALEKRRSALQRSLSIFAPPERRRRESELGEIESQLRRLRQSYDRTLVGREASDGARQASLQAEREMSVADRRRREDEERICRTYANERGISDIVTMCEKDTIGALERAISDRMEKADSAVERHERTLSYVTSVSSGLDGLNAEALRQVKTEVDGKVKELTAR